MIKIHHDEKILIFGGPYSNYNATRAVLDEAQRLGVGPSNVICTGDVAAYCARPDETASLVRQSKILVVQGNCDENLGNNLDNCGCGFEEKTVCHSISKKWYDFSVKNTSDKNKIWMKNMPTGLRFEFAGKRFHVFHGSFSKINQFVFPSTSAQIKKQEVEMSQADVAICGHSGLHFTELLDNGKIWHNAGVIGMPANDGTPRTWYSVISSDGTKLVFEHKVLNYDFEEEASYMISAGLSEYGMCLKTGLWPSLDILPDPERNQTSVPIEEQIIII